MFLQTTALMTEVLPYSHCGDPTARQRQHRTLNNSLVMAAIRATLCLLVCVLFFSFFSLTLSSVREFSSSFAITLQLACLMHRHLLWETLPWGGKNIHSFSFQRYFYHGGICVENYSVFWVKKKIFSLCIQSPQLFMEQCKLNFFPFLKNYILSHVEKHWHLRSWYLCIEFSNGWRSRCWVFCDWKY